MDNRARKKKIRKRRSSGVRKFSYVFLMVIIVCAYLTGQCFYSWQWLTETTATIIAIIAAVAFWLEYHENKLLNEAQFIIDLNEQFLGDRDMSEVEWELEKYFNKYEAGTLREEHNTLLREKYAKDSRERQHLVNYLVHLESIATLVKNRILHIDTIDDLMSYRYFIAVNNPVVQEEELLRYPDYYRGCFDVYDNWVKTLKKQGITPPMYNESTNNLTKKRDKEFIN